MAEQRNTGKPPDAAPEAELPASPGGTDRGFAARWSARVAAVRPALQRVLSPPVSSMPATPGSDRGPRAPALRWGLVALLAVVLLAGGAAFSSLSHAPQDAARQLCTAALAGQYDAAYDLLGAAPRGQVSRADFARIGSALDRLEGRVTSCTATSYEYALGSSQAALSVSLVRGNGAQISGQVVLDDENGWKVAALAPDLTGGATLGALDVALRFCDALHAGDSSQLFSLSDADASAGLGSAQQLATNLTTWQQVDGPVTGCALAGTGTNIGASSGESATPSDDTARLTLGVTRARRGTAVAVLGLARSAQGWRVNMIGANLLGSDLGPLHLGQRFCAALASGSYASAYALFSPAYTAQVTLDQFTAAFAPLGGSWSCTAQLNTYAVSSVAGTYDVALSLNGAGPPLALMVTLHFTLSGGTWTIQDIEPRG